MVYRIPDTVYDSGVNAQWQNANDRVAYQRAFDQGDRQTQKIAQALMVANPLTPNLEIQVNMNQPDVPARFGYDDTPATINRVLASEFDVNHVNDKAWNDFSGSNGEYSGTEVPSLPIIF